MSQIEQETVPKTNKSKWPENKVKITKNLSKTKFKSKWPGNKDTNKVSQNVQEQS